MNPVCYVMRFPVVTRPSCRAISCYRLCRNIALSRGAQSDLDYSNNAWITTGLPSRMCLRVPPSSDQIADANRDVLPLQSGFDSLRPNVTAVLCNADVLLDPLAIPSCHDPNLVCPGALPRDGKWTVHLIIHYRRWVWNTVDEFAVPGNYADPPGYGRARRRVQHRDDNSCPEFVCGRQQD